MRLRIVLLGLVLVLFGTIQLFTRNAQAHTQPNATTPDSTTLQADSILQFWLSKRAVYTQQPARRTFYLWMNARDLDTCLAANELLNQAVPFNSVLKQYDLRLRDKEWTHEPLADILKHVNFTRKRDAWPVFWGALTETSIPDQLVKVELADSALLVEFSPTAKKTFRVFDLKGRELTEAEALKRKHQIAVVYFEDEPKERLTNPMRGHEKKQTYRYKIRSYVLCNEQMIRAWHHATPEMQNDWLNEIRYLLLLDAWVKHDDAHIREPGKNGKYAWECWHNGVAEKNQGTAWYSCLRKADATNPRFTSSTIQEMIDVLRNRWNVQQQAFSKFPAKKK